MSIASKCVLGVLLSFISSGALAGECSLLASSRYRDEMRTLIRSELSSQGVKVIFSDEIGVSDYETPFKEVPEQIDIGENFNFLQMYPVQKLPPLFLGQLYTSGDQGLFEMTTITEFTFGVAEIKDCRVKKSTNQGACKAILAEKGPVFERVTAKSNRDLIVVGGELKDLQREKAPASEIRAYLRDLGARLCR